MLNSVKLLAQDFPLFPMKEINIIFAEHQSCILPTYLDLEEIAKKNKQVTWAPKKSATKRLGDFTPENLDNTIAREMDIHAREALLEFQVSRQVVGERRAEREAMERQLREEEENLEVAREAGNIEECGCCFDEFPINRMVHCDAVPTHVSGSETIIDENKLTGKHSGSAGHVQDLTQKLQSVPRSTSFSACPWTAAQAALTESSGPFFWMTNSSRPLNALSKKPAYG